MKPKMEKVELTGVCLRREPPDERQQLGVLAVEAHGEYVLARAALGEVCAIAREAGVYSRDPVWLEATGHRESVTAPADFEVQYTPEPIRVDG